MLLFRFGPRPQDFRSKAREGCVIVEKGGLVG